MSVYILRACVAVHFVSGARPNRDWTDAFLREWWDETVKIVSDDTSGEAKESAEEVALLMQS